MVDRNKIYAVKAPEIEDETLALYVDVGRKGFQGVSYTVPGGRGHSFVGQIEKKTRDGFTFICTGLCEGRFTFTEVTYENFKKKYHKLVLKGEEVLEQVHSTEELQDYYHANFPDYT